MILWLIDRGLNTQHTSDLLGCIESDDIVILRGDAIYSAQRLTTISPTFKALDSDCYIRGITLDKERLITLEQLLALIVQAEQTIRI